MEPHTCRLEEQDAAAAVPRPGPAPSGPPTLLQGLSAAPPKLAAPPRLETMPQPAVLSVHAAEPEEGATPAPTMAAIPAKQFGSAGPALDPSTAVPGVTTLDILAIALEKSGSAEAAERFGVLLRRWALEGRPYRGRTFQLAEVEAAIVTATKNCSWVKGDKSSQSEEVRPDAPENTPELGRLLEVHATIEWPPTRMLDAAADATRALGKLPAGAAEGEHRAKLLPALFELTGADSGSKACDVEFTAADGEAIRAHRAILVTVSPVLGCRFSGRFADAGNRVDASEFSASAVGAAIEFVYLGQCRVKQQDFSALFAIADKYDIEILTEAVLQRVSTLPTMVCLDALATWDADACGPEGPAALGEAFAQNITLGLSQAAAALEATEAFQYFPLGWRFVREFQGVLAAQSAEALFRVRQWILSKGQLGDALEKLVINALSQARTASAGDIKSLNAVQIKALLSNATACRICEDLCARVGFYNEEKQLSPWLRWAHTGNYSFSMLWQVYQFVRNLRPQPRIPEDAPPTAVETAPQELPEDIEKGFAFAIADAVQHSASAAAQWDELLWAPDQGPWPVLQESVQLLALVLRNCRSLPKYSSARAVQRIICKAAASDPPASVRIMGPDAIAGVYNRDGVLFSRCCTAGTSSSTMLPTVLRRVGRGAVKVEWKGIPTETIRVARVEWKVQAATDDKDVDTPLAIALDEVEDPCKIMTSWWIRGAGGRFRLDHSIEVVRETLSPEGVKPYVDAVVDWAKGGGSMVDLARLAGTGGNCHQDPTLMQVCRAAVRPGCRQTRERAPATLAESAPLRATRGTVDEEVCSAGVKRQKL